MFKKTNLFKIIKNLFGTKKLAEKNTVVVEEVERPLNPEKLGGSNYTKSKFTKAYWIKKKKKNRLQGQARNINHRKAA